MPPGTIKHATVSFTDTCAHEIAVVIKGGNAFVAPFVMMGPDRWGIPTLSTNVAWLLCDEDGVGVDVDVDVDDAVLETATIRSAWMSWAALASLYVPLLLLLFLPDYCIRLPTENVGIQKARITPL